MSAEDHADLFLVLMEDSPASHRLSFGATLVVGRGDEADIRVEHSSVSRAHARLRYEHRTQQLWLEDLGSANGTWIRSRQLATMATPSGQTATTQGDVEEQRLTPGTPVAIAAGTIVRFGSMTAAIQRRMPQTRAPRGTVSPTATEPIVLDASTQQLHATARRVAASAMPILIMGETGSGKEVLAETVWRHSSRSQTPLLRINCGAFTESLLASELFGHIRGAFTGATVDKPGLLESANGGTILLDEIGEAPPEVQTKLLRVLEEGQLRRVGAVATVAIDVRFIAATNRDLQQDIAQGSFRRDLYYRISGVTLKLPPLRERPLELIALAEHFIARAVEKNQRSPTTLSVGAQDALRAHRWPGNVRELQHAMERALLVCSEDVIEAQHLGLGVVVQPTGEHGWSAKEHQERERIVAALDAAAGNQTRAALALGISRGTLVSRLAKYGLKRPRGPRKPV